MVGGVDLGDPCLDLEVTPIDLAGGHRLVKNISHGRPDRLVESPAMLGLRIVRGRDDERLLAAEERELGPGLAGLRLLGHDHSPPRDER